LVTVLTTPWVGKISKGESKGEKFIAVREMEGVRFIQVVLLD